MSEPKIYFRSTGLGYNVMRAGSTDKEPAQVIGKMVNMELFIYIYYSQDFVPILRCSNGKEFRVPLCEHIPLSHQDMLYFTDSAQFLIKYEIRK